MRAEEHTSRKPSVKSGLFAVLALAAFVLTFALTAAPAGAKETHVFLEAFGSAAQPSFSFAASATVDQSTGDVLVIEAGAQQITRYHSDGTPSNFSALATNAIDGAGPGSDQTPQNGLSFDPGSGVEYSQIAVDNSGTATDGDIYVTQNVYGGSLHLIDVFASSGEYLGQITGGGGSSFGSGPLEEGGVSPCGVAVDPKGNVFVGGWREDKIYKFDPAANPPVNADNVATFPSPEPCQLAAGAGPSAGSLFVKEYGGLNVFKLNGSSGALAYVVHQSNGTDSNEAKQIAVNPADGHLFVPSLTHVTEYDASQSSGPTVVSSFSAASTLVAVDKASGKVYLTGEPGKLAVYSGLVPLPDPVTTSAASNIEKTSATLNGTVATNGEELSECFFEYGTTTAYGSSKPCAESFAEIGTGFAKVHADISGLEQETVYHYRLIAGNKNGKGDPGKDETFQTKSKPQLLGEWVEGVTLKEATLKAQINPQSAATEYRFEWGLGEAPYEHVGPEIAIGSAPTAHTVSLFLQGLAPGTEYHFRLVAENEIGESEGADHAFTTFAPILAPETNCPNQAFRSGASAFLPDCRAYEMVSPVDKNGGDIVSELEGAGSPSGYVQASPDGNKITYSARFASFAGEPSSFFNDPYLAARQEGEGWSSQGIHPPVAGHQVDTSLFGGQREFIAFSPDLCSAWLADYQTPPPSADGQPGYRNLYRRQNCGAGAGSLEALVPASSPLPPGTSENYVDSDSVQGVSADSRHALFIAYAALTPDAHPETKQLATQIYDRFGAANHLVSVLPGGVADPSRAEVGSGVNGNQDNAVSADGSRVYWTSGSGGSRKIYLREHPEQGIVAGECKKATKACTLPVSGSKDASFWTAAADGSKALYGEGSKGDEDLYEFDLKKAEAEEPPRLIAHHVKGVLGAAEDLSRIYFVSTDALTSPAEPNSEGDHAVATQPNLYLDEGGTPSFVATLVAGDIGTPEPGAGILLAYTVNRGSPYERATRVTPDGAHLAFESRAPLTDYDNTDTASGKPAVEVFAYRAGGALACVSCNPSGGRPSGVREIGRAYQQFAGRLDVDFTYVLAAAWIPTWEHPLHASNVLSADGGRLFFNSNDALLTRDTNGAQDVYEWEAPGTGRCDAKDADYFPQNGGCLYLISSGESPSESEFWEASPDGADVFFTTTSSLLPQDPGLVDLYDARVEGGFPRPVEKAQCEGEACQSAPPAPNDPTPASSAFRGAGNLKQRKGSKSRCPKGKRKVRQGGKPRCIARRHKSKQRRANDNRRAPR